jgi:thioredoxin-like negative regulator of GroEL
LITTIADVDQLNGAANDAGISSVPAFFFVKDGEKVDEFVGGNVRSPSYMTIPMTL